MIDLQIIGIGGSIAIGVFLIGCGWEGFRTWRRAYRREIERQDALEDALAEARIATLQAGTDWPRRPPFLTDDLEAARERDRQRRAAQ